MTDYSPPEVWTPKEMGGAWAKLNRPTAGATHEAELPVGEHPLQLYSLGTPNGVKVTILLEELLALDHSDAEYDAWLINITEGAQFSSGFVAVNPNSKIPALLDHSTDPPTRVFESGSILLYLAERFGAFLPTDPRARTEALNWLFWQMGAGPFLGGGFGHFYAYAPSKMEYPIDRFTMETKRQLDVLDRHLAENSYMAGDAYSIADMAHLALVRRIGEGPSLRRRNLPVGARVRQRPALGRRHRSPPSGPARSSGESRLGRQGRAAARTSFGG